MRIVIRRLPYYDSHFFTSVKYGIMTDIFIVFALLCLTFLAYKYYAYHNYYVGHSTYKYAILSISSPVFSAEKRFFAACFPIFRRYFIISRDIRPAFFHFRISPQRKSGGKSPSLFHQGIFSLISAVYLLASVIFLNIQVDF